MKSEGTQKRRRMVMVTKNKRRTRNSIEKLQSIKSLAAFDYRRELMRRGNTYAPFLSFLQSMPTKPLKELRKRFKRDYFVTAGLWEKPRKSDFSKYTSIKVRITAFSPIGALKKFRERFGRLWQVQEVFIVPYNFGETEADEEYNYDEE